jgi:hypothetical protein
VARPGGGVDKSGTAGRPRLLAVPCGGPPDGSPSRPGGARDILGGRLRLRRAPPIILSTRFVFLHLPKTGGTFASKALARVLRPRNWPERLWQRCFGEQYLFVHQHGTRADIPEAYRHLPVVGIVRNPYDRYVSEFHFGRWKLMRNAWVPWDEIRREHPRFPEVGFEEYLEIALDRFGLLRQPALPPEDRFGPYTETFVRFFWRDPERAFPAMDDAYIAARGWERELEGVRLLHQEDLNRELHDYLRAAGYPARRTAFILELGRIQPDRGAPSTRPQDRHWSAWYTPRTRALVRHRDRLLFAMFPEYDAPDPGAAGPGAPG